MLWRERVRCLVVCDDIVCCVSGLNDVFFSSSSDRTQQTGYPILAKPFPRCSTLRSGALKKEEK